MIHDVYPDFFFTLEGPLKENEKKFRGHMNAHRTPISKRTTWGYGHKFGFS
jgi:hypothetical protein